MHVKMYVSKKRAGLHICIMDKMVKYICNVNIHRVNIYIKGTSDIENVYILSHLGYFDQYIS